MFYENEKEFDTVFISDEIENCEDVETLKKEILPMIATQKENWKKKINEIIEENQFTKTRFAKLCGVSRVTVDSWCKGAIPKSRETFIRIGMAANYNLEQMNQLLQRYGRYPALYSKSLEDCVCIYVLNHVEDTEKSEKYNYILSKIKENIIREDQVEFEDIPTERFDEKLLEVHDEEMLEKFIRENVSVFSAAYHKLYGYINLVIEEMLGKDETVGFLAMEQGWSSSLRQCVSAIKQKKWYPTRNKIISLGLHLCMERDEVNDILEYAHMEPLYAKNIFESVIIYILETASITGMINDRNSISTICDFAKSVLEEFDFPGVDDFISELAGGNEDEY